MKKLILFIVCAAAWAQAPFGSITQPSTGGGLLPYTGTGSPSGQNCVGQPNAVTYGGVVYVCNGTVYVATGGSGTITGVTAGSGLSGGGTSGAVTITGTIPCVGTPGNTTGNYRQPCQTSTGAVYACNNAAGCTVAADWVGATLPSQAALTNTGNPTGISAQPISIPVNTAYASAQAGSTADAKITAAIYLLPTSGGIVDATGLTGAQLWSTCPTFGSNPVLLITGAGVVTYTGSGTCTIPANVTLSPSKGSVIDVANISNPLIIYGSILAPSGQQVFANPLTGGASSVIISGQNRPLFSWFGPAANVYSTTGGMSSSSSVITGSGLSATTAPSGETCVVGGANTGSYNLLGTISYPSGVPNLSVPAVVSVTGAIITCGTLDTVPLLNAIKATATLGLEIDTGGSLLDNSSASGASFTSYGSANNSVRIQFDSGSEWWCATVSTTGSSNCAFFNISKNVIVDGLHVNFAGNAKFPTKVTGGPVALLVANSLNMSFIHTRIDGGPSAGIYDKKSANSTYIDTTINHTTSNAFLAYSPSKLGLQTIKINDSGDAGVEVDNIVGAGLSGTIVVSAVVSGAVTTGVTGATGSNCALSFTNTSGGSGANGYVYLTSANTIATGTVISVINGGGSYGAAPTTATLSNGVAGIGSAAATCSGTINVTSSLVPYGFTGDGIQITNSFNGLLMESKAGALVTNLDVNGVAIGGISVGNNVGSGVVAPQNIIIRNASINNVGNYSDRSWDVTSGSAGPGQGTAVAFNVSGASLLMDGLQVTNTNGTMLAGNATSSGAGGGPFYVGIKNSRFANNSTNLSVIQGAAGSLGTLDLSGNTFELNNNAISVQNMGDVMVNNNHIYDSGGAGIVGAQEWIEFSGNRSLAVNGNYVTDDNATCVGCKIRETSTANIPAFQNNFGAITDTTNAPLGQPVIVSGTGSAVNGSQQVFGYYTVGVSGTTAGLLAAASTASPSVAATAGTGTFPVLGIAQQTVASGGNVQIVSFGVVSAIADNSVNSGDYIGVAVTTAGRAHDLGSSLSSLSNTACVIGKALSSQSTVGGSFSLFLTDPGCNFIGRSVASLSSSLYNTATNCSSSTSPAVCSSAASGSVSVAAASSTVTVNTTAVTANSQIQLTFDSSLGTKLGVTCNTTAVQPTVLSRTAATSFTIAVGVAPVTNPACFSYSIIN